MLRNRLTILAFLLLIAFGVAGSAIAYVWFAPHAPREVTAQATTHLPGAGVNGQVQYFCSSCHAYPPHDIFPRSAWKEEVERGYRFFSEAQLNRQAPPMDQVISYYEALAPEELPPAVFENAATPPPVAFAKLLIPAPPHADPPGISNIQLVHLFDDKRLDVLACDMRRGQVLVYRPYLASPAWKVLADVPNPAHAEVIDLDQDGIKDILVANLGSLPPTDAHCGSVIWLRGKGDGTFTPHMLLADVGRVADVQAGDFRGTGKLDLVVACFGWNHAGEIRFLENQTEDWNHPKFVSRILDKRHGSIHVPVIDLNDDGKLDFVALISQEHETIVAFLNDGRGNFTPKTLYTAPHPAYGSSGIQLVDINGDGKIDILYTNGDTGDKPYVLKPYHGVQWLENMGNLKFEHHFITPLYGAMRAVAADFTGTGRMDIVAVNFLPAHAFPQRKEKNLDSLLYLEQIAPGRFVRHSLETASCDHLTCAAGDLQGRKTIDLVTGNFSTGPGDYAAITIWKNKAER
jgi:hypothetical protein